MTVAFHRGLTHEFKRIMQLSGVRVEEQDAQLALSGLLTRETDVRGNPIKSGDSQKAIRSSAAAIVERTVEKVLHDDNRFDLMRKWEEDHPGQPPFPPIFPEIVIAELEAVDLDNSTEKIAYVIELARQELLYG